MIRVLLLEEDASQKKQAFDCIYGYDSDAIVDCVENGEQAKRLLQLYKYDIVLIHYDAPGVCEYELWKYMRESPVMIFTSNPDVEKEIFCYNKGALDYVARPYNPKAVVARGERLLKRNEKEFGKLKINYKNDNVVFLGKKVLLTPIEKKFLFILSQSEDGMTFEDLSKEIWGYDEPDMNSMRVLVSKINKKIDGGIENIRNWGYRIKT